MNKILLVIFDLDGTLVDAYAAITASFNFTMKHVGYPQQPAVVIRRAVGWGDRNLLKPFVRPKDLARALHLYRKHHTRSLVAHSRLFGGVHQVLRALKKQGLHLAVASNRPTKFSLIVIRHLGLDRYFEYVLCADKLKKGKPHPQILRRIMEKFSVCPQQALYVGDMAIDAQAGRRAKVRTVIVTTGSSSMQEILREKPWRIIPRIASLPRVIKDNRYCAARELP